MEWFNAVHWGSIFMTDTPVLEIIVRGSVMYLSLFCLLRFMLKRQAGSLGMTDLLVIVLMADAAQNGMAGDYKSVPDGLILVSTLVFWNYSLEWLAYRYPFFERIIHPAPLVLVKNGRLNRKNMKKQLISEDDIMSCLREEGLEHIKQVKEAYIEGDGKISITKYD